MADQERLGFRDLLFSREHRPDRLSRYLPYEEAVACGAIDIDFMMLIEFDRQVYFPVAFIEHARDVGQKRKCATVTQNTAMMCQLPAACVMYKANKDFTEIISYRFERLWPKPDGKIVDLTPEQFAHRLNDMRKYGTKKILERYFPERLLQEAMEAKPATEESQADDQDVKIYPDGYL
jgi:hypothetical protein